jgi:hypothetical protein
MKHYMVQPECRGALSGSFDRLVGAVDPDHPTDLLGQGEGQATAAAPHIQDRPIVQWRFAYQTKKGGAEAGMIRLASLAGLVWPLYSMVIPLNHQRPLSLASYADLPKDIITFFGRIRGSRLGWP